MLPMTPSFLVVLLASPAGRTPHYLRFLFLLLSLFLMMSQFLNPVASFSPLRRGPVLLVGTSRMDHAETRTITVSPPSGCGNTKNRCLMNTLTTTPRSTTLQASLSQEEPVVGVALVGAGIFATNTHLPTILRFNTELTCRAIWSKSKASATALFESHKQALSECSVYYDDEGFTDLLKRDDIQVVIMALPLDVQPNYVPKILQSGKNLLSEKPIAPTLESADILLRTCRELPTHHWSVAENFRHEPAIQYAAQAVSSSIGKPLYVTTTIRAPFLTGDTTTSSNPYLNTFWRQNPSWGEGGLFVDAFPHGAAAIRSVVGEVASVSMQTTSESESLPGVDTMNGTLNFQNGAKGVLSVSYASTDRRFKMEVNGSAGTVTLDRTADGFRVTVNGHDEFFALSGIENEYRAFLDSCRGKIMDINTPENARKDLSLVEACLLSGSKKGETVNVL